MIYGTKKFNGKARMSVTLVGNTDLGLKLHGLLSEVYRRHIHDVRLEGRPNEGEHAYQVVSGRYGNMGEIEVEPKSRFFVKQRGRNAFEETRIKTAQTFWLRFLPEDCVQGLNHENPKVRDAFHKELGERENGWFC